MLSKIFAVVLGAASLAAALPTFHNVTGTTFAAAGFGCDNPPWGLSRDDCNYLSSIGFAGPGSNPSGGSNIRIGNGGPNTMTFSSPNTDVVLVMWERVDDASAFVAVNRPRLTWSLPRGSSVTVSLDNGVSGAWSAIYGRQTRLAWTGVVENTWGEFTTGGSATVNISREPNMGGNNFVARVSTGCQADMDHCSYVCKQGNSCWQSGSYSLIGCTEQPNNNAYFGGADPSGGCQGWSNNGHIDAYFY
ncbi:hypothetical protein B0T24DRAFT_698485 [Lasiosphaeria ovina]|uniref:Uncharacterized protein n=1 Tax=Lasiosphaeria ovina TaxID=92902 RepID=A0AAE0KH51_9PEZI|nr:hypothetical protein B0T24DRAFT_698485 [Lasiosphaeria ovina]